MNGYGMTGLYGPLMALRLVTEQAGTSAKAGANRFKGGFNVFGRMLFLRISLLLV